VGSNIFNIFLILSLTSIVREIPIRGTQVFDIGVLLVTTTLLFLFLFVWRKYHLGKVEGLIMLTGYVAYTIYLILRG
jgi:cation:H+ antiporter